MKKILIIYIFLPYILFAQNATLDKKRDYQQPFGYQYFQNGNLLDFNQKPSKTYDFSNRMKQTLNEYNSAICDVNGQLAFLTNGCDIYNKNFEIMKNGDKINPGIYTEQYFCKSLGLPIRDAALILPFKNNYLMLHTTLTIDNSIKNADLYSSHLSYSIVDMKGDNGLGEVILKNKKLIEDTLSAGDITTCRHANGTDWWVIVPQWSVAPDSTNNNKYYRLLVKQDTILGPWVQEIGIRPNIRSWNEQVCFSPDGTKYARLRSRDGLMTFDFDRQTGLFSNSRVFQLNKNVYRGGVCFSPDSRYLYASMDTLLYQIDMKAGNPKMSKEVIAEWDGFKGKDIWPTTFDGAYLGPDCKIYITPASTIEYLHVINYPNRKGKASGFEQRGIKTPTKVSWSLPNYPHFRLGAVGEKHTPCDSTINNYISDTGELIEKEAPISFAVYPNPAQDHINVDLFGYVQRFERGTWDLYDMSGRLAASFPLLQGHDEYVFDISSVPNGVYVWHVSFDGRASGASGKLVVLKE